MVLSLAGALLLAPVFTAPSNARSQIPSDSVQSYVGNIFLMRGLGGAPDIHVKAGNSITAGQCDAAVSVISVSRFAGAAIQLRVEPVGSPQIDQRATMHCSLQRQISISITGSGLRATESGVASAIDKVLLSPEAYLAGYGITKNQPAISGDPEFPIGQSSMIDFVPPQAVLSVYADYTDAVKQSSGGSVVVQALIGRDGRVYSATVLNGLSDAINDQVLKLYRLWRLKPAHVGDQLVAYQLNLQTRFR